MMGKREYSDEKEKREIKKFIEKNNFTISAEKISEFEEQAKVEYPMPTNPCRITRNEVNYFRQRRIKKLAEQFVKSIAT